MSHSSYSTRWLNVVRLPQNDFIITLANKCLRRLLNHAFISRTSNNVNRLGKVGQLTSYVTKIVRFWGSYVMLLICNSMRNSQDLPLAFANCFSSSLIRISFSSDFVLWNDCDLLTEGGSSGRVWTLIFLFSWTLCHFCAVRDRSFLLRVLPMNWT